MFFIQIVFDGNLVCSCSNGTIWSSSTHTIYFFEEDYEALIADLKTKEKKAGQYTTFQCIKCLYSLV